MLRVKFYPLIIGVLSLPGWLLAVNQNAEETLTGAGLKTQASRTTTAPQLVTASKQGAPLNPQDPPTALQATLPTETLVRITCDYHSSPQQPKLTSTYHYRIWLPASFSPANPKKWKVLFIASPQGNADLGSMADWIKHHEYVAVALEESRNGPAEPVVGNFLAAHDDLIQRIHVAEGQKICTGFSGGARACSTFVTLRPGFGGLILQGAGCAMRQPDGTYDIKGMNLRGVAVTMGKQDANHNEIGLLSRSFGSQLQIFEFAGGHQWAPAEVIAKALDGVDQKLGP